MKQMRAKVFVWMVAVVFCAAGVVFAQETGQELKEQEGEQTKDVGARAGAVRSLEDRIAKLEGAVTRDVESENWYDRVQISGLIEVEAAWQSVDVMDEEKEDSSSIELATAELVFDVNIHKNVDGHVMFKYEADEVFVDEGFITIIGTEAFPAYLIAGRQYVPFGFYDSMFVTDPTTLVLGETNQDAVTAGYRFGGEMVNIAIAAFNGSVNKVDSDDHINTFTGGIFTSPLEGLSIGASYTSNLASSDTFSEFANEEVDSLVGGWGAYATYEFLDRFKVLAEYVGALDSFKAGEIYGEEDTKERQPSAWNVEAGMTFMENLGLALRYGGADDGGAEFLPETQYGAILNYGFFNCNLALEYLHDEFEDDAQEVDTFLAQLAVSF